LKTSGTFDAVHDWFSSSGQYGYTLTNWNGKKTGVAVPGFGSPASPSTYLDPSMGTADKGKRLKVGLDNTVKQGAMTTLIEGFTDAAESAALWRSTDEGTHTFYDYANQRLNILRSYSKNPFPIHLKMEVEACDFHSDLTPGNSGGAFLDRGDLDVVKSTDVKGGWSVTNTQANEWMEWRELPLVPENKFEIRYKSTAAASVFISIDGIAQPTVTLPATANVWTTINAGNYINGTNSARTVRLTIASGSPDINYFTRTNLNTGPVSVATVAVTPTTANIIKTKTLKLEAALTPSYATNTKVTWTSSDPSIATVDAFGLVTGINIGSATITVTTEDGAKIATSAISIENPTTVITLQAEEAVFNGPKAVTNQVGYNGTSFLDFANNTGDFIKWTVSVPAAGEYELSFRYALLGGNRPLELRVNGTVAVASLFFPVTSSWSNWQNVMSKQNLNAGANEIQLTSIGSNGGNFDELVVTNTVNLGTNSFDVPNQKTVNIYPNPFKEGVLKIDLAGFENSNDITVTVMNLTGQTIYQTQTTNLKHIELNLSKNLNESIYFVSIASGGTQIIKKLIVK
ncbi:MAG: DUF5010 domain-containing protein, partial [Flavobacterium sp.]